MNIVLKYGREGINFDINDKNLMKVLTLNIKNSKIIDTGKAIKTVLRSPAGTESLVKLLKTKKPKKVAVILEDVTRANPEYPEILSALISVLEESGVFNPVFIIAYGTHRKHSEEETERLYKLDKKYIIVHHDCDDKSQLVSLGKLSTGNELLINKTVAEADFIITTGNIEPHSFAGYTGGRKAILPGVAARESITISHSKVKRDGVVMGKIDNNPIHEEMLEAGKLAGIDFILNVIRNDKKEIVRIVAGDFQKAFDEGVKFSKDLYSVKVEMPADVIIVSCGGYPRDVNLYQAQKCITASSNVIKNGGTIILLAECSDGVGQDTFEDWMKKYTIEETMLKKEPEIVVEGHRAYLTKKIMSYCDIIVISSVPEKIISGMGYLYQPDIQSAMKYIEGKYGTGYKTYVIPNGSAIIPQLG